MIGAQGAMVLPGMDAAPNGDLTIDGTVCRVAVSRGDFHVLEMEVDKQGRRAIETWAGEVSGVAVNQRLRGIGRYERHATFGDQFKFSAAFPVVPTTSKGIADYLGSGVIKGVGPSVAKALVKHFGEQTVEILDTTPDRVIEAPGIGPDRAEKIKRGWAKSQATARVMIFLQGHGAPPSLATKIVRHFLDRGEDPLFVVSSDPYRLAIEVHGVGFVTADIIARSLGVGADSEARTQAGALHLLSDIGRNGHTLVDLDELVSMAAKLLKRPDADAAIRAGIVALGQAGRLKLEPYDGEPEETLYGPRVTVKASVFLPSTWEAEWNVAKRIHAIRTSLGKGRAESADRMRAYAEQAIQAFEEAHGFTLAPEQREAVFTAAVEPMTVITGGPGTGKCLGRGTPVLMFDGSIKPVEEVRDGDLVMGPDSQPRRVSGTTQGVGPLYEIRPIKGAPWVCNDVHVLTLVRSGTNEVRDIPLDEYMALGHGAKWRQRGKLFKAGVDFPDQPVPLDPYIVGLWLGDGTTAATDITTAEPEVIETLVGAATACGLKTMISPQRGCWNVRISSGKRGKHGRNVFRNEFRALVTRDGAKHIPERYKVNSREKRLALLAGLIDTDGFVANKCVEIATKWREMADDIAFLARSLGICVTIAQKYVQLEGWAAPRLYYRLMLSGNMDDVPTRVPRRKIGAREQLKDALRTGFDVVPLGDGEYFGFQLDGDGRFLLGDFTVTHNTTIVQVVLNAFAKARMRIAICAPTGKAANRITETSGRPAATIHRLLGIQRGGGPLVTRDSPLPCDVLLCDETSMVDLKLASYLLDAAANGTRVIFVGDKDQLPSVQPGAVLRDIITSGVVPVVTLDRIYRQGPGSTISKAAEAINHGRSPKSDDGAGGEFFIVERTTPESAAATIEHLVTTRIPKTFGIQPENIAVMVPQHRGVGGTQELNTRLQNALNPQGAELVRRHRKFRVGDKVMQLQNNYDREIFNGDVGVITAIDREAAELVVDFGGGRSARLDDEAMDDLTLAYASTIHKNQGSESPAVVIYVGPEHFGLSRALVYTAVTRGRKLVVVVSTKQVIARAVRETKRGIRRTRLAERLRSIA